MNTWTETKPSLSLRLNMDRPRGYGVIMCNMVCYGSCHAYPIQCYPIACSPFLFPALSCPILYHHYHHHHHHNHTTNNHNSNTHHNHNHHNIHDHSCTISLGLSQVVCAWMMSRYVLGTICTGSSIQFQNRRMLQKLHSDHSSQDWRSVCFVFF